MPPRRSVRGHPARRNIEEQELPNALEQRRARQEEADTSRIREFLRMNPPSFTGLSTAEDPENFIEELKKVFDVMHATGIVRVEFKSFAELSKPGQGFAWGQQWSSSAGHVHGVGPGHDMSGQAHNILIS
ncbi:hypothetical protein MTR67_053002 [Solanum verrucosum]|uniref:Gag-pol polyprotein n=1 Tax=Solanum verrucosum TaxID=315347 RepID=A0AAF0V781_SOLVR|nr:hypothetical protein MTR67_053002 [Solanum verrucosum]